MIPKLKQGRDSPRVTERERLGRLLSLRESVEFYLPEVVECVRAIAQKNVNGEEVYLMLHQDAFAAGYDLDEYTLLGMAVKYAGLHGVDIIFISETEK